MEDIDVEDPYADLKQHRIQPVLEVRAIVPRKIQRRRQHFTKFPMAWVERLSGAFGKTWELAVHLLYLHWKDNGQPIKLANGMLATDGISRHSKYRALADLERRGLITVERRPRRSPIVRLVPKGLWL
jgi:hypothetical protein